MLKPFIPVRQKYQGWLCLLVLLLPLLLVHGKFLLANLYGLSLHDLHLWHIAHTAPLYQQTIPSAVMGILSGVAGTQDSLIRGVWLLAALGCALLLYHLGKILFSRRIGLWSALVFLCSPMVALMIFADPASLLLTLYWLSLVYAWLRHRVSSPILLGAASLGVVLFDAPASLILLSLPLAMLTRAADRPLVLNRRYAAMMGALAIITLGLFFAAPATIPDGGTSCLPFTSAATRVLAHMIFSGGWLFLVGGALLILPATRLSSPIERALYILFSSTFLFIFVAGLIAPDAPLPTAIPLSIGVLLAFHLASTAHRAAREFSIFYVMLALTLGHTVALYNWPLIQASAAPTAAVHRYDPFCTLKGWRDLGTLTSESWAVYSDALLLADDPATALALEYYAIPRPQKVYTTADLPTLIREHSAFLLVSAQATLDNVKETPLGIFPNISDVAQIHIPTANGTARDYHVYYAGQD